MSISDRDKDTGGGGGDKGVPPAGGEGAAAPSYSDKLKMNVKRAERFKRNVLEITLESDPGVKVEIDPGTTAKLLTRLGIEKSQCSGVQPCPGFSRKIFVWMKEGIDIEKFCKDESYIVTPGIKTGIIRPMGRREVSVLIKGLNFNCPDSLVREYLSKHGKVVSEKVIYEGEKQGPLEGLYNGNRRYHIDFTMGKNLGSYHIIDGSKVHVLYAGQQKTCGRCHKTSRNCPGGGIARQCEDRMGPRVSLIDHMRQHWEELGFTPNLFELDLNKVDDNMTEDMEIKEGTAFTPPKRIIQPANDAIYSGVVIKNLPLSITEDEIEGFLVSQGLPGGHVFKTLRTQRNTNVDIENLITDECHDFISSLNEETFFNRKLYCRGMVHINTPTKDQSEANKEEPEINEEEAEKDEEEAEKDEEEVEKDEEEAENEVHENNIEEDDIPCLKKDDLTRSKKKKLRKRVKKQVKDKDAKEKPAKREDFLKDDSQEKMPTLDLTSNSDDDDSSEADSVPTEDSEVFHTMDTLPSLNKAKK